MKTLIENLTSDLLPNQIFQTGFSFLIILKGNSLLKLDSNVLIFIMSGTMKVSSAQQELATVRERHIFFWDKEDDYTCEMLSDSQVILFAFGDLIVHDLLTFRPFGAISDSSVSKDVGFSIGNRNISFTVLPYMVMSLARLSMTSDFHLLHTLINFAGHNMD